MRPYEIVILFDAGLEEGAVRDVVDRVADLVKSQGGNPGHVDHWGRRRFAYPIDHKTEGYYVLIEANSPPEALVEIDRMLSLSDEVVRHKVIKVPEKSAGRSLPTPPSDPTLVAEAS